MYMYNESFRDMRSGFGWPEGDSQAEDTLNSVIVEAETVENAASGADLVPC